MSGRLVAGERGQVFSYPPSGDGGTVRMWRRDINGWPYEFTHVLMPDGEVRWAVSRYNGYCDGTPEGRAVGMRFGCAWSPVHFLIRVRPDGAA